MLCAPSQPPIIPPLSVIGYEVRYEIYSKVLFICSSSSSSRRNITNVPLRWEGQYVKHMRAVAFGQSWRSLRDCDTRGWNVIEGRNCVCARVRACNYGTANPSVILSQYEQSTVQPKVPSWIQISLCQAHTALPSAPKWKQQSELHLAKSLEAPRRTKRQRAATCTWATSQ